VHQRSSQKQQKLAASSSPAQVSVVQASACLRVTQSLLRVGLLRMQQEVLGSHCRLTCCSSESNVTAVHAAGESQQQQEEQQPAGAEKASGVMGPAARLLLQRAGLSADDIRPTGPNGIITKVHQMTFRHMQDS
jgi:pyruvate/2-oxoglutarate dehydrogenase complex dihydrolipoamide acyltransferase (E2) component